LSKTIVIYGKKKCKYCADARMLLELRSVPYEYIDIEVDLEAREEVISRGPQIVVDGEWVGGYTQLRERADEICGES
jgi:glutaredoxin